MAAAGDMGASAAPQLIGVLVDEIAASPFASSLVQSAGMTPDQVGLKGAMLIAALFPLLGTVVVLVIRRKLITPKAPAVQE